MIKANFTLWTVNTKKDGQLTILAPCYGSGGSFDLSVELDGKDLETIKNDQRYTVSPIMTNENDNNFVHVSKHQDLTIPEDTLAQLLARLGDYEGEDTLHVYRMIREVNWSDATMDTALDLIWTLAEEAEAKRRIRTLTKLAHDNFSWIIHNLNQSDRWRTNADNHTGQISITGPEMGRTTIIELLNKSGCGPRISWTDSIRDPKNGQWTYQFQVG